MHAPRTSLLQPCLAVALAACGTDKPTDSGSPAGTTATTATLSPPTADAGPDLKGPIGTELAFDGSGSEGIAYLWDFGDGVQAETQSATHTYTAPGNYTAVLQVTGEDGSKRSDEVRVIAHRPQATGAIDFTADMKLSAEDNVLWAVVADADSLIRIDLSTGNTTRTPTCGHPRALALHSSAVAVTCESTHEVALHTPATGALATTAPLGQGARPIGIITHNDTFVATLNGSHSLATIALDGTVTTTPTAADPRAIARAPDGELLATRWRSPDEEALIYSTTGDGIALGLDERPDSDTTNRGVPNLLDTVVPSPDGGTLYVGGLQANVLRGTFTDGEDLTFETTMRAIVSAISLDTREESLSNRKVIDDRGRVGFVLPSPLGERLYLAHPGFQSVSVLDAYTLDLSGSVLDVGHTPTSLAVSPDGTTLYVHASLDREVRAYDVSNLSTTPPLLETYPLVDEEPLSATILNGKRLFHSSRDTRLAKSGYITCSNCHPDGRADGLTWDFTSRGEGLRNTTSLEGRAGMAHGRVHWSGNFDEIQDFEADIRLHQGGLGLLSDEDWAATQDSLGAPKAGLSADLDALAEYVASLTTTPESPHTSPDGGAEAFASAGCAECHPAPTYTDSSLDTPVRHDVGTIWAGSGSRLGEDLDGLDTPTLLGVHASAPYLHDGSADTVEAAVLAHDGASDLDADTLARVVGFVESL